MYDLFSSDFLRSDLSGAGDRLRVACPWFVIVIYYRWIYYHVAYYDDVIISKDHEDSIFFFSFLMILRIK